MQNAGLGAVLALKHFSSQAAIPNALFATWCIVTASLLVEIWSRRSKTYNLKLKNILTSIKLRRYD